MKKHFFLIAVLSIAFQAYSQVLNNTLLGFQEPTTKIIAIESDGGGYIYYFGLFKGALIRNNQTLITGSGGDDLFIIKTDTAGNLVWARNYGGDGNEQVLSSGNPFRYANGALFFNTLITYTTQMGSFTVAPYGIDRPASCIVRLDTANGNVLWARKTSLLLNDLQANNNILMISGMLTSVRGAWLFEQQTLQDSSGISRRGIMYIDRSGNFLGKKQIYQNFVGTSNVALGSPMLTNSGQIFFYLSHSNTTGQPLSLYIQDSVIVIPTSARFYAIFSADTSFANIRYRLISGTSSFLTFSGGINSGITYSSVRDSLYFLLETSSVLNYTLDGFNVPLQNRSTLVVMDSSLITKRVHTLHQLPGPYRVRCQVVFPHNGHLFFNGAFNGTNQAIPLVPIPPNIQTVEVLDGMTQALDINGPGRSVLIKANLDLSQKSVLWLGDATLYDGLTLSVPSITTSSNKLYFANSNDETWNPWIIDTSLVVINGAMVGGRDRAENSRLIQFFNDGSKFIQGEAYGKTAFDTTGTGIVNSSQKSDVFFARLGTNNNLLWYKRIFTSFRRASQVKTVIKNNKAYALMTLGSPANAAGYNYFKFDTTVISVTNSFFNVVLLINADGTYRLLDLNNVLPGRTIVSFDVYDNGDMAAVSTASNLAVTINGVNFPAQNGYFILRLDSMANVIQALKYQSTVTSYSPSAQDILIHPGNDEASIISAISFQTGVASRSMILTDGQSYLDTFTLLNPKQSLGRSYLDIMRVNIQGRCRSVTIGPLTVGGNYSPPFVLNGTKLYLPINKGSIRDTLFLNTQVFDPDTTKNSFFLVGLDTAGQIFASQKFLPPGVGISIPYYINKLTSFGNQVFSSGSVYGPTLVDTIQVGYSGGVDGLTIGFDTLLNAKKVYRLHSIYQETINDCAVYNDSLISFAYTAQSVPAYVNSRVNSIRPEDVDEDAYVSDALLGTTLLPLPVTWRSINAHCKKHGVAIEWSTSNELNSSHFVVERSRVAGIWIPVGELPSIGNSNSPQSYHFFDSISGAALYRIRQVDINGRESISKVINARCEFSGNVLRIFPNPVRETFVIQGASEGSRYQLFNSLGQRVQYGLIRSVQHHVIVNGIPNGLYQLLITDPLGVTRAEKVQIQR
jgi:hypothetical protein